MTVTSTQNQGLEPTGFGVAPFVLFPQLKGSIFETQLALSMLGAQDGRMHGPHPPPEAAPTSVHSYEHVSQLGRDQQMTAVVRVPLIRATPPRFSSSRRGSLPRHWRAGR